MAKKNRTNAEGRAAAEMVRAQERRAAVLILTRFCDYWSTLA